MGTSVPQLRHSVYARLQSHRRPGRASHHPAVEHRRTACGRLQRRERYYYYVR